MAAEYSAKKLCREAEKYFNSISRRIWLTEEVDSGERDEKGRPVLVTRQILNDLGEPVSGREYLIPPTVTGLLLALGLSRSRWERLLGSDQPRLAQAAGQIHDRILLWYEEQLSSRQKSITGVTLYLRREFGYDSPPFAGGGSEDELPLDEMTGLLSGLLAG